MTPVACSPSAMPRWLGEPSVLSLPVSVERPRWSHANALVVSGLRQIGSSDAHEDLL